MSNFPKGDLIENEFFTGNAYLAGLDDNDAAMSGNVTFDAGARNNWHVHTVGQTLFVTDGTGIYQEDGKPAQRITAGDVIYTPAGVKHWHGATADSAMSHIAVTYKDADGEVVEWLEPVSDVQFSQANKEI